MARDPMTDDQPDWLWNGGKDVDDPDLYDKQLKEDDIAWGGN